MSGEKVVSIDGLTFSYDGLKVLEDVNLFSPAGGQSGYSVLSRPRPVRG